MPELDSDSDSDSDLEFLATHDSPAKNPPPANRAAPVAAPVAAPTDGDLRAQLEALRRELWEKSGENVILRSQLEKNVSLHERELGDLINKQSRAKEQLRLEVESHKKEAERVRAQHQFLQAELKTKAGSRASAASVARSEAISAPRPPQLEAGVPLSPSKRRPVVSFSDGFVLKKQRILPSTDTSQSHMSQVDTGTPTPTQTRVAQTSASQLSPSLLNYGSLDSETLSSSSSSSSSSSGVLLSIAAQHKAPGNTVGTLQLLYAYKLPGIESVGHEVSACKSFAEFVDLTMVILEQGSSLESDDYMVIVLALLYSLSLHALPLDDSRKRSLAVALHTTTYAWLKQLSPLPTFDALLSPFALPVKSLRLLTCILYALDILATIDLELDLPPELSRRLLTCAHAPHVIGKTLSLLCLNPKSASAELVKLINTKLVVHPTLEILFSGLVDVPLLTLAELRRGSPAGQNYCRLVPTYADLAPLRLKADEQAKSVARTNQSACIQLAFSLQFDRAPAPISMHAQILNILTSHIDCSFPAESIIVQEAILFFWCFEPSKVRDELNEHDLAELEVCLSKLVYASHEPNETVDRSRQLLQALTGGADTDLVFGAFEPRARDEQSHQQASLRS